MTIPLKGWQHKSTPRSRIFVVAAAVAFASAGAGCGGNAPSGPGDPGASTPGGQTPGTPIPGALEYRLAFSTYLGGSGDEEIRDPTVLADGRLLFGARTESSDMPTTPGAVQPAYGGGVGDSYLAIMSSDGRLDAATYFGGSGMERPPYGIAIAPNGDIVFTSGTASRDIPTSASSYRPALHQPLPSPGDGYVCQVSSDLTALRWCTYTGGGWPRGGLAIDDQGNVIVVGTVQGVGFATTSGAFQEQKRGATDAFILKLDPTGSTALFSTLLGGNETRRVEVATSVNAGPGGELLISGTSQSLDFPTTVGAAQPTSASPPDAFVAKLHPNGTQLLFSTLLGGSRVDAAAHGTRLLGNGAALLVGLTNSSDFPSTSGSRGGGDDNYIANVDASGAAFQFVRVLGGSSHEEMLGPVLDDAGNIYVYGTTDSRDLPITDGAFQPTYGGGQSDGFFMVLSANAGTILYSTYLGGSGGEFVRGVALDPGGDVYLVGFTESDDLPISANAFQTARGGLTDGFVIKLERVDR